MTQGLTNFTESKQISADRADRMTAWWPRLPTSQIANRTDRDQIEASINQLWMPCETNWLMARVMALLTPYFTSNVPEGVRRIEAEDWRAALEGKPAWAIEKACRWWKSDENPDHRRKPMEGDIVERVKFETGILSFAAMKVRDYDRGYEGRVKEPEPARPTPEEMERRREFAQSVMVKSGFAKKMDRPKGPPRETVTEEDLQEMRELLAAKAATNTSERA